METVYDPVDVGIKFYTINPQDSKKIRKKLRKKLMKFFEKNKKVIGYAVVES